WEPLTWTLSSEVAVTSPFDDWVPSPQSIVAVTTCAFDARATTPLAGSGARSGVPSRPCRTVPLPDIDGPASAVAGAGLGGSANGAGSRGPAMGRGGAIAGDGAVGGDAAGSGATLVGVTGVDGAEAGGAATAAGWCERTGGMPKARSRAANSAPKSTE